MLTVGFIGNGKSANRYHIPFILQKSDKIKIKMIYTRKHSRDAVSYTHLDVYKRQECNDCKTFRSK